MKKVRIFLSDWQVLFREGVHFTLSGEEDFEVIGEETSNKEALDFIEKYSPRVAILNADTGEPSGIEITRRIKQDLPSVLIILFMDRYNDEQFLAAMKSGASACLTKEVEPEELVNIVRKVIQGSRPISEALFKPEIASRVIDEFETISLIGEEVGNVMARLLPAESEILQRIAGRSPVEEITMALGISEEAIRRHLDLVLNKLEANFHNYEVIEAAQSSLKPVASKIPREAGKPTVDYVTKEEFSSFKETLMERLKSVIGKPD